MGEKYMVFNDIKSVTSLLLD